MSKNDPALLQVWTNTVLGEPFEPAQETVEGSSLLRRGENYGPQSIPDAVRMLTAGVDVQGDRIEVQILGFGAFEEVWAVRYEVLPGDPAQRGVWDLLDGVLTESYRTDAGRELRVRVTCVDSGGHHQHQVLTYCRNRSRRGVLPIKGIAGPRPVGRRDQAGPRATRGSSWSASIPPRTRSTAGCGSASQVPAISTFRSAARSTKTYFAQLTAETVQTRFKEGRPYRVWVLPPGKANEALDTAVYALAARHATRVRLDLPLASHKRHRRHHRKHRPPGARHAGGLSARHAATAGATPGIGGRVRDPQRFHDAGLSKVQSVDERMRWNAVSASRTADVPSHTSRGTHAAISRHRAHGRGIASEMRMKSIVPWRPAMEQPPAQAVAHRSRCRAPSELHHQIGGHHADDFSLAAASRRGASWGGLFAPFAVGGGPTDNSIGIAAAHPSGSPASTVAVCHGSASAGVPLLPAGHAALGPNIRTEVGKRECRPPRGRPLSRTHYPPLWEGLGGVTYRISPPRNELAQSYFNQGLRRPPNLPQRGRSAAFRRRRSSILTAPCCPRALVLGPNINLPMQEDAGRAGLRGS